MTREKIHAVCSERLATWANRMASEHATPVLALGVGHDHHIGNLTLHITEDLPDEMLREFVKFLYAEIVLKRQRQP
jgi:hypothetical protein